MSVFFRIMPLGRKNGKPGASSCIMKRVHFAADLAMVALLGLFEHAQMLVELFFSGEGGAVDAGEHLVVLSPFQ